MSASGAFYKIERWSGFVEYADGKAVRAFNWIASARTYRDAKSLIFPEGPLTGVLRIKMVVYADLHLG